MAIPQWRDRPTKNNDTVLASLIALFDENFRGVLDNHFDDLYPYVSKDVVVLLTSTRETTVWDDEASYPDVAFSQAKGEYV